MKLNKTQFVTVVSCLLVACLIFVPYEKKKPDTGVTLFTGYDFVFNLGMYASVNFPVMVTNVFVVLIIAALYFVLVLKNQDKD